MPTPAISVRAARQLALRAQGLTGPRFKGPDEVLARLGAVQLDTISVLARSHLLVAWSRLGPCERDRIEDAYWHTPRPKAFEYWAHAACILPIERWPDFGYRRRKFLSRGRRWHRLEDAASSLAAVRDRLRLDGPLTAGELGGAKRGGPWWDWTETKIAVEWLLDIGEVACVERRGWRRVYDLAERAIPPQLFEADLDDASCLRSLAGEAGRALGIATLTDLARHSGLSATELRDAVGDAGLVEVTLEHARRPWFADPDALAHLDEPVRHRSTLLSPFDSVVWDRDRTERLFGFVHRLEAYTPKADRQIGYFAMPILTGGQLVGAVDPARDGARFVARHLVLVSNARPEGVATALRGAAAWVGAEEIRVERVTPESFAAPLRAALASAK